MTNKIKTLRTRFGPETRFEVPPRPAVPFRGAQETELEQFKARLLREALAENNLPAFNAPLRRAANDAATVAWVTPFPLLVLPELFAEKARTAIAQTVKQQRVYARSRAILAITE
ncbi:MAG: hypothetical protein HY301_01190 [Verrucomicrobia bacterium]|nr:hypothetical protein [Verrucomicrobiota bacterium]